jgi:deoxyadenosine/deoxycytidine kinase
MHESAYRKINRKIEDLSHSILRDYTKEFGNFYDEWLKINPDENEITVNEEVSDDIFAETEIEADVKIADESVADFATEIAVDSDINDTENFGL